VFTDYASKVATQYVAFGNNVTHGMSRLNGCPVVRLGCNFLQHVSTDAWA